MNYCPNNTLTHYTTTFPKITDQDGTCEIGLAFHFHIDFMIDFIETHVEFILEFLHVLFPLDGESFWPRNSTHPVTDVKRGLNSLYVYCPLMEPRMVGDAQVPLLRIVPMEGRDGEMITRVFDPI
jgi:hypothetical protein